MNAGTLISTFTTVSLFKCTSDSETKQIVKWLQSVELLPSHMACKRCLKPMTFTRKRSRLDGFVWYCICHTETSVRQGSFFEKFPKTSLFQLLRYIYLWSIGQKQYKIIAGMGIAHSKTTASKLLRLLNAIAVKALCLFPPHSQGGVGKCVQVDESLFVKRKYNRGRLIKQRWVFGILCMEYDPPRPIFHVVENRRADTLIPILRHYVKPLTQVSTDCFRSYSTLNRWYQHRTVNHSIQFVDPVTGAHTQSIESEWGRAKKFAQGSVRRSSDATYLQEALYVYMWQKWLGNPYPGGPYVRILQDIRQQFPV